MSVMERNSGTPIAIPASTAHILDAGLVDVDVAKWGPRARRFTWWKYGVGYSRNLGMRIDIIATDTELATRLDTTWIDHTERSDEVGARVGLRREHR